MFIYFVIPVSFFIFSLIGVSDKSYTKLCLIILTLIAALRFNVGVDYSHYLEQIYFINNGLNHREIEFSFIALVKIINFFGLPDYFVISAYAIMTTFFLYLNLEKNNFNTKFLYFWTFFPHFYLQSFNLIRLMLAVAIVWYAIQNISQKKSYFLLIFLAIFFHTTAIFGIVIYFVLVYKIRPFAKIAILGIIVCIDQTNLMGYILEYTNYRQTIDYNYDYRLLIFLLIIWILLEIFNFNPFYKDLAFLSFVFPFFFMICDIQGDLLYRISYYSMIFIPVLLSCYKIKVININLNFVFCMLVLPIYFIYNLILNGASFKLLPYHFLPLF